MPGLGTAFGRGAATNLQEDLQNSERGAQLIHVDPHFSRTSARCNQYVALRTGTDIVFLGALINYILENDLWFHEYVLAYTNATTLINSDFKDAY